MSYAPSTWVRAFTRTPCPVCGHKNHCTRTADGTAINCTRTPSQKPIASKTTGEVIGYLHRPDGAPLARVPLPAPIKYLASAELLLLARQYRTAANPARLERHAAALGVTVASLQRLRVGWSSKHSAWAFPMVDPAGGVMGIRLRQHNGRKFAVTGGHDGLFIPDGLPESGPLVICEGPTSLAALLDMGLPAVGRASCTSGGAMLKRFAAAYGPVVVLADRDEWKTRPDGSKFRPGQDGGNALARLLACRVVQCPVSKDARDWKASGVTAAQAWAFLRLARSRAA